ncbi:hypothetical protein TNCV_3714341 [Trichonephila clavipes]|nr:hypothetical protein TNCV_3714341 [Trichonephila clavipes]
MTSLRPSDLGQTFFLEKGRTNNTEMHPITLNQSPARTYIPCSEAARGSLATGLVAMSHEQVTLAVNPLLRVDKMGTKNSWELNRRVSRQTDHMTGTSAHAPQGLSILSWVQQALALMGCREAQLNSTLPYFNLTYTIKFDLPRYYLNGTAIQIRLAPLRTLLPVVDRRSERNVFHDLAELPIGGPCTVSELNV